MDLASPPAFAGLLPLGIRGEAVGIEHRCAVLAVAHVAACLACLPESKPALRWLGPHGDLAPQLDPGKPPLFKLADNTGRDLVIERRPILAGPPAEALPPDLPSRSTCLACAIRWTTGPDCPPDRRLSRNYQPDYPAGHPPTCPQPPGLPGPVPRQGCSPEQGCAIRWLLRPAAATPPITRSCDICTCLTSKPALETHHGPRPEKAGGWAARTTNGPALTGSRNRSRAPDPQRSGWQGPQRQWRSRDKEAACERRWRAQTDGEPAPRLCSREAHKWCRGGEAGARRHEGRHGAVAP